MLYIRGGTKEQIELSQQLFNFCSNGLFQANNMPNIDLFIQKVDGALAWTDYEGDRKFFIEIEEKLAEQFYQEELSSGIGNSLIDLNED
jgi:hypothetical protein